MKCCVALRYCYNMKHIIHIRCLKDNDKNRIYNISRCIESQSQTVQRSHEVTKVSSILGRKPGSPKGCHSYSRGSRDEGQVSPKWRHYYQQVCVQQPTYADNVPLPAFARRTPLLQQSIDISPVSRAPSSKPAAAILLVLARAGTERRTDGRTPYCFIDPAAHIMRAMPIKVQHFCAKIDDKSA